MTKPLDTEFIPSKDNKFILYRSFFNLEEGRKMEALLEQYNIPHLFDIPRESLSSSIIGEGMNVKASLKVLAQDFKRIDKIIADEIKKIPFSELQEHPLQEYSDEDLYHILLKPDEWNIENITMAQIILSNRGKNISEQEIERLEVERMNHIRQGKEGSKPFMFVVIILLFLGFLGNKIALFIVAMATGAYYTYAKKHDMNGDFYYEYETKTRQIGKGMFFSAIVLFLVKALFLIYLSRYTIL